jgi:hypothetical protein
MEQVLFYGTSFERARLLAAPYMRFKTWMRERSEQPASLSSLFSKSNLPVRLTSWKFRH